MRGISSFLFAFVLLLSPAAAHAAPPDAKGAAELKHVLADVAGWYAESSKKAGQTLTWKGDIAVTPREKDYTAVISGVSILSGSGFRIDVGDIAVNAAPSTAKGEEGGWVVSVALPAAMPVFDAAGDNIAHIAIGRQRFSAVWMPAFGVCTRIDAEYGDIALKVKGGIAYDASLSGLKLAVNLAHNADDTWSGPHVFEADGIAASLAGTGSEGRISMKIGKLLSRSDLLGVSLEAEKRARDKLKALGDDAEQRAAIDAVVEQLGVIPDTYALQAELDDAAVEYVPAPGGDGAPQLPTLRADLLKLSVGADMSGLRQQKSRISTRLNLDTLNVTGAPKPLDGLIPHSGNIDLRFENVPAQQLVRILADIMRAAALAPGADKQKAASDIQALVASLPGTLSSAGAALTIADTYVQATDLKATLEGRVAADASSPIVAVGAVTFALEGLDALIAKYRAMAGDKNPAVEQYLQGVIPLQLAGQLSKNAFGSETRTYKFEFTPDGKTLLNGADISVIQAMLKGAASAP